MSFRKQLKSVKKETAKVVKVVDERDEIKTETFNARLRIEAMEKWKMEATVAKQMVSDAFLQVAETTNRSYKPSQKRHEFRGRSRVSLGAC